MKHSGLFAGLTTVDIQYFTDRFPVSNKKVKTSPPEVVAGGPATNAAVAFACLNNGAVLASPTGSNSFSGYMENDFNSNKLEHINLYSRPDFTPVIASVITSAVNGDRNIFTHHPQPITPEVTAEEVFSRVKPEIVLLDGFYPEFCIDLAWQSRQKNVPVVLDCGSWKPQLAKLLSLADIVICSEDFLPPECENLNDVFLFLKKKGIQKSAISRGEKSLVFYESGRRGEITIEKSTVEDTLGAGDFLHGAFCFYFLETNFHFEKALKQASKFATFTCRYKGTRSWIKYFQI